MTTRKIVLFNKPYGVLSQFTTDDSAPTLADYLSVPDVYAAGRLDKDSEGLLILTNDGELQQRISHPRFKMAKTYWAQVEGIPSEEALQQLRNGVELNDGMTKPARIEVISEPQIWPRTPPIRFRQHIPTTWLAITLTEGRNRQVRRMTAAVGYPTLRLIRVRIGDWELGDLQPGEWHEVKL